MKVYRWQFHLRFYSSSLQRFRNYFMSALEQEVSAPLRLLIFMCCLIIVLMCCHAYTCGNGELRAQVRMIHTLRNYMQYKSQKLQAAVNYTSSNGMPHRRITLLLAVENQTCFFTFSR